MRRHIAVALISACALPVLAGEILEFRLAQSNATNGWSKAQFDGQPIWLSPKPELTATHVASAEFQWSRPALSPEAIAQLKKMMPETTIETNRHPQISIKFTEKGTALFAKVTGENYRKRLAILSDDTILTAPVIMDSITGGVAVISGNFTEGEAKDLTKKLNKKRRTTESTPTK